MMVLAARFFPKEVRNVSCTCLQPKGEPARGTPYSGLAKVHRH
jgi:hypothetical protein